MSLTDIKYMKLAISLANAAAFQTSPNPPVGAVVVKNGKLLALGTHLQAGSHHAEINAFKVADSIELEGSTLYVTLEPCCHVGKTNACTDAIIKHKINRVVIASLDQNPLVQGNGVKQLKDAKITVDIGVCELEASQLYNQFFHFIKTKMPYITLKAGLSLDGKLATSTHESKWITCQESRDDAHTYRYMRDAILVGIRRL